MCHIYNCEHLEIHFRIAKLQQKHLHMQFPIMCLFAFTLYINHKRNKSATNIQREHHLSNVQSLYKQNLRVLQTMLQTLSSTLARPQTLGSFFWPLSNQIAVDVRKQVAWFVIHHWHPVSFCRDAPWQFRTFRPHIPFLRTISIQWRSSQSFCEEIPSS